MKAIEFSDGTTHVLLVKPGSGIPLVRIQLHCLTSTAFASNMCDCAQQMKTSLALIQREPFGAILYLCQEARGHGLLAKCKIVRAINDGHALQDAQRLAGFETGKQDYRYVPLMLREIPYDGPIDLLTSSAPKMRSIRELGVMIRQQKWL